MNMLLKPDSMQCGDLHCSKMFVTLTIRGSYWSGRKYVLKVQETTRMHILTPHLALTYPNHCPTSCRTNSHFVNHSLVI